MSMLTVCALVCTTVALAGSAVLPETKAESNERAKTHLIKRSVGCGGWFEFNRRCFYFIPKPMSWALAERNCMSLGGHLASVHNFMEYHELQRLILHHGYEYQETWIGGSDAHQKGHWIWSDGSMFYYTNWCPGEPNNAGGHQHCLQMNYSGRKCWDDLSCYDQRPSVCAKNM
ncbi:ladderlectin-like [Archocentrus centrarchus]|uniref:ladderlectin-like n=1 Tax=Archocentrus centrarchus TaxID=63155 RepID=UPI0011EA32AC|nr:ladderlectin-like [Archocentrus centrarchus]